MADESTSPEPLRESSHELVLSIGGEVGRLTLEGVPGPFLEQLRNRYEPWGVPASPILDATFSLRVKMNSAPPARPGGRMGDLARRPLAIRDSADHVSITRWDFEAHLSRRPDGDRHRRWGGSAACELNVLAFDSLLRVLWSIFLPRAGGALVHACSVRVDQAAIVLPGPSGMGKSTFASKMADADHVLTDELTAIIPDEAGGWRACSTPFWGDFRRGGGSIRSWPLKGFAFLGQSTTIDVRPLSPAESTARLLGCFLYFGSGAEATARNFELAAQMASSAPAVHAQLTRQTAPEELFAEVEPSFGPFHAEDPPASVREMISEFRWLLRTHGHYAYTPRGSSMQPYIQDGESIFVAAAEAGEIQPGEVLLYWTPGPTPHDDQLTCHRLVATRRTGGRQRMYTKGDHASGIGRFDDRRHAEVLGKVGKRSAEGTDVPLLSQSADLARLILSVGTQPFLKWMGR